MIYTGRHVRSPSGAVEPSLINPELPIAGRGGRLVEPGTGPALAYHLLSPAARGAYLEWLAGGRRADVPTALVLLFCFGLERRVLVDADRQPTTVRRELPAITAEVRRLRIRYAGTGAGPALGAALGNLLDLLELLTATRAAGPSGRDRPGEPPAPVTTMAVRVALARHAVTGTPVPSGLARAWTRCHPSFAPRRAELGCPTEFDRLFALRYRARHGRGLVLSEDAPGIRLRYQPANPGLASTLVCREDLPDVLTQARGTRALRALLDDVAAALDPYRRWLARFPQGRGSLAAATLLPAELVDAGHGELGALRVWGERQLDGRDRAIVDTGEFRAFWSTAAPERMARDEAAALLTVLGLVGLGVEPDVRFGAPALAAGPAVLFRLGRPAAAGPSARFPAAAAVVRCAAAVAASAVPDATVPGSGGSGSGVLGTVADLAPLLRLGPGEDLRLAARLAWLLVTGVDVDRLGRQTASLTAPEREIAGHYLITVAVAADPTVGPATVAILTRVYRILGLAPDLVFPRLHERSVGAGPAYPYLAAPAPSVPTRPAAEDEPVVMPDEPVVVQVAVAAPSGYALPWAPEDAHGRETTDRETTDARDDDRGVSGGVRLDQAAVQRKIAESSVAASLLTAIFDTDPEPDTDPDREPGPTPDADGHLGPASGGTPVGAADRDVVVPGLDAAHSALLRALASRPAWTQDEFAALAAAHRVLPDGAIDLLNEVAIDTVGAPVVEGGAPLAVDTDVLLELLA